MRYFILIGIVGTLSYSNCSVACDSIRLVPSLTQVFLAGELKQSIQVEVRKSGGPCSYFVGATRGLSRTFNRTLKFGAYELNYNLYTNATSTRVLKDIPDATPSEVLTGSFSSKGDESQVIRLYIGRPEDGMKAAGVYSDSVMLKVYRGEYSTAATPVDTKLLPLSRSFPLERELSIVPTGASAVAGLSLHNLDFNELTEGKMRSFDFVVRTNADYSVRMSSRNHGRLKNNESNHFIRYFLKVDGAAKDLSRGEAAQVASGFGVTPPAGRRHSANATIGSVNDAAAGNYTDTITITVEGF